MEKFNLRLSENKYINIEYTGICIDECYIFLFDNGERFFIPFNRFKLYLNNGKLIKVN
jgi:hypothetical protein